MRETDDGSVLLHCFAGCDVADVMESMGLSLADLFADRPPERGPNRKGQRGLNAAEKVVILERASWLVLVAAEHVAGGVALSEEDRDALYAAVGRIQRVCGGAA